MSMGGATGASPGVADCDMYAGEFDSWTNFISMGFGRRWSVGFGLDGKVYVCGGSVVLKFWDTDEYFDDVWTAKTTVPLPLRTQSAGFTLDGVGYYCGGAGGTVDVDAYDPDTWTGKANCSPETDRVGSSVDGKGYVIGGNDGSTQVSDVDEYDSSGDSWTAKTGCTTARQAAGACTIGNAIYLFSGLGTSGNVSSTEEYDPDTWTNKASIGTARNGIGAVTLSEEAYIWGGNASGASNAVEAYDAAGNVFRTQNNILVAVYDYAYCPWGEAAPQ